jgi:hypothetical protein
MSEKSKTTFFLGRREYTTCGGGGLQNHPCKLQTYATLLVPCFNPSNASWGAKIDGVLSSWDEKFCSVTSDVHVLWNVGRGIRILIKKTNYITRLETARRIY